MFMYVCMHIYAHKNVFIYIYIHKNVFIYIYTHKNVFIYIYTHEYKDFNFGCLPGISISLVLEMHQW